METALKVLSEIVTARRRSATLLRSPGDENTGMLEGGNPAWAMYVPICFNSALEPETNDPPVKKPRMTLDDIRFERPPIPELDTDEMFEALEERGRVEEEIQQTHRDTLQALKGMREDMQKPRRIEWWILAFGAIASIGGIEVAFRAAKRLFLLFFPAQ